MWWMKWLNEEPVCILTKAAYSGVVATAKGAYGWLLGKGGSLKRVLTGPAVFLIPNALILSPRWRGRLALAGGIRPYGPARLRGVLHYFTRGPDQARRGEGQKQSPYLRQVIVYFKSFSRKIK